MSAERTALEVLARVSGRPPAEVQPQMQLAGDLGIDSPKALELLWELEDALGIEIKDEDAALMESVGDVLSYVSTVG